MEKMGSTSTKLAKKLFGQLKAPMRCSWTWWKILELRPLTLKFCRIKVGNGELTRMWWDSWFENDPLCTRVDQEMLELVGIDTSAHIADYEAKGLFTWRLNCPSWIFSQAAAGPVLNLGTVDKLVWRDGSD